MLNVLMLGEIDDEQVRRPGDREHTDEAASDEFVDSFLGGGHRSVLRGAED